MKAEFAIATMALAEQNIRLGKRLWHRTLRRVAVEGVAYAEYRIGHSTFHGQGADR